MQNTSFIISVDQGGLLSILYTQIHIQLSFNIYQVAGWFILVCNFPRVDKVVSQYHSNDDVFICMTSVC